MINIFREPAQPLTLFSYSDFFIIIFINLVLYFIVEKKLAQWTTLSKIVLGIFFFIVIPLVSANIELNNAHNKFEMVDGFNLLYIFLKFPVWWLPGIVNINFFLNICSVLK